MNRCSEFVLDDLLAIIAIPVTDYNPGFSLWQLTQTIPIAEFLPVLDNAIAIGQKPAVADGALIPIIKLTGKAKDDESDSVASRMHKVSVSCQADDRDSETWNLLLALERTPSHLLLTFRGGTRGFVQATADTYTCVVEREGAKTSITFSIENTMGIQLLA